MYSAKRIKGALYLIAPLILMAILYWSVNHIERIVVGQTGQPQPIFSAIYVGSFIMLAWQSLLYLLDKPKRINGAEKRALDRLKVIVNIPVYNEDAQALEDCIKSILRQSRQVQIIHIVVNGPNKVDYSSLKANVLRFAERSEVEIYWDQQAIPGKRQAQGLTIRQYLKPDDIFVTIDSDAYLDKYAVEEGLKPLADRKVMSVAGLVLNSNNRASLLTRMSDLWFLTAQLVDRASYSVMGSVLVNSGVLAFYRGHVVLDNLDSYLNETFFGRPVEFSDDSMLTLYALQKGKTVQQTTSFSFTLMPEKLSHHVRQQVRWMRGSFIRSWWRFKYLPMMSYAYWAHFIKHMQAIFSLVLFVYLFIYLPVIDQRILPYLLVIPIAISYFQSTQYLTVSRNDEKFWYRFRTWLLTPLATIWAFTVLRVIRYYSIITVLNIKWGTRQAPEVKAT